MGGSRVPRKTPRVLLIESLGAKCSQCGSTKDLELDHERPLAKGGADSVRNLRVLCRKCHRPYPGKRWFEDPRVLVNFNCNSNLLEKFDQKLAPLKLDRTTVLTEYMAAIVTGTMNIQVVISLSGEEKDGSS